jgi:iron complex transport system ATP-binding protein
VDHAEEASVTFFGAYGVSVSFGGRRVLEEVSFELEPGSFTALLGPNGSGKSTLLKACAGVISPDEGRIRYQGVDLVERSARERARIVTYVAPELTAEFPLTAAETVMLGQVSGAQGLLTLSRPADREAVREAMERCQCWELRERELHSLSGGERQLVALAKALVQQPKVLLLDETLSRMDLHHQARVGVLLQRLARESGVAVMLVAHDVNLATEWSGHCVLLRAGKLVVSGPIQATWTTEALRKLYPEAILSIRDDASGKPKVSFDRG